MATVNVVIANVGGIGQGDNQLPGYVAKGARVQNVTSPGTGTVAAKHGQWARITPVDAPVYVNVNSVTSSTGFYLDTGVTLDLALEPGDVIASVDA